MDIYKDAEWDLSSAVDIEDSIADEYMAPPLEGKCRVVINGLPEWGDVEGYEPKAEGSISD